jgi:hypothetical protein
MLGDNLRENLLNKSQWSSILSQISYVVYIHKSVCIQQVYLCVCVCVLGRGGRVRISAHVLDTHMHHHLLGNGSQQKNVWLFFPLSFVVIVVVMMIVCVLLPSLLLLLLVPNF